MFNAQTVLVCIALILGGLLSYLMYTINRPESWEVIVPRSSIGQRELPANFVVKLYNPGNDVYVVDFPSKGKEKLIDTIFLHRPEDEPMLHYVLKTNMRGVVLDTLPASTTANLWLVENMGMCWSSVAPLALPQPGETKDVEMTVAFCI